MLWLHAYTKTKLGRREYRTKKRRCKAIERDSKMGKNTKPSSQAVKRVCTPNWIIVKRIYNRFKENRLFGLKYTGSSELNRTDVKCRNV